MNSSEQSYLKLDDILSVVLPMVNDLEYRDAPKGFYTSMVQKALEELGMDTFFDERRESFDLPGETLTLPLPKGCFNVRNIYLFNGDECNISNSIKVWWKRNYFTRGNGYIANDKFGNTADPFFTDHFGIATAVNKNLIRWDTKQSAKFFYGIQMGNIMFSSYCRGVANKVMIHYNGTGCDLGDMPFIPVLLRTAVEDYVIESILRMKMAKDMSVRNLWAIYDKKLRQPYEGSWEKAETRIKTMNSSQRNELFEYLSRPSSADGS